MPFLRPQHHISQVLAPCLCCLLRLTDHLPKNKAEKTWFQNILKHGNKVLSKWKSKAPTPRQLKGTKTRHSWHSTSNCFGPEGPRLDTTTWKGGHTVSCGFKTHETSWNNWRNEKSQLQAAEKCPKIIELLATSVVPVCVNANASRQMWQCF